MTTVAQTATGFFAKKEDARDELLCGWCAESDDADALLTEGQFSGSVDGFGNDVAYLPSCGRAVLRTNGNPVWFDATSLEDAIAGANDDDRMANAN